MSDIVRIQKRVYELPYFQCSNAMVHDLRLGLDGMGLLAHIRSKPDTWETHIASIARETGTKESAVRRAISKCIGAGYIMRLARWSVETRRFHGYDYIVSDIPMSAEEQKKIAGDRKIWAPATVIMCEHRTPENDGSDDNYHERAQDPPFSGVRTNKYTSFRDFQSLQEGSSAEKADQPRRETSYEIEILPPASDANSPSIQSAGSASVASATPKAGPARVKLPSGNVVSRPVLTPSGSAKPIQAISVPSKANGAVASNLGPSGKSKSQIIDAWCNPLASTGADPGVLNVTPGSRLAQAIKQWNAMAAASAICPLDGKLENSSKGSVCVWLEDLGSDYAAVLAYLGSKDGMAYAASRPTLSLVALARSGDWSRTLRHTAKRALGLVRPVAKPQLPPKPTPPAEARDKFGKTAADREASKIRLVAMKAQLAAKQAAQNSQRI